MSIVFALIVFISAALPARANVISQGPRAAKIPPSTFATDTFTGVNGTLLTAHTSDSGNTWAVGNFTVSGYTGDAQIQSNTLQSSLSGNPIEFLNATPANAGYDVSVDCNSTGGCGGPGGRISSASGNGYVTSYQGGGANRWELHKIIGNVDSTLQTFAGDVPTTNKTLKLQLRDATKKFFINGVERMSDTDNGITAAGNPGVNMAGGAEIMDNFQAVNQ